MLSKILKSVTKDKLPKDITQFLIRVNRGDSLWWFTVRREGEHFVDSDGYVISEGIVVIYPLPNGDL